MEVFTMDAREYVLGLIEAGRAAQEEFEKYSQKM